LYDFNFWIDYYLCVELAFLKRWACSKV